MCIPLFFLPGFVQGMLHLTPAVWTNMVISAVLAVVSNMLLIAALSESDLSVIGPINAYKSVVSLILGMFLLHEQPTRMGLAGVVLIVAGSYFVIDRRLDQPLGNAFLRFFRERGIQLRFAALFLSATEAIFLKRAILLSSPWPVFVLWSMLGLPVAVGILVLVVPRIEAQGRILRAALGTYVLLALATGMMQLATLLTFNVLQVGYALALFQLSTVVSVVLGQRYFAEQNIRERFIGSAVMAAGAALILLANRHQ